MSYMTISSQKNRIFHSVHAFTHIRQHYFSKYWGGPMHGRSPPPQIWGGAVPPSPPLGLRPWWSSVLGCLFPYVCLWSPRSSVSVSLHIRVCLSLYSSIQGRPVRALGDA